MAPDFALFKNAFDCAPNKAEWQLIAAYNDIKGFAQIRRQNAFSGHWRTIERLATEGQLHLKDHNGLPMQRIDDATQISVEEARAYLAQVPPGFELIEDNDEKIALTLKPVSRQASQEAEILAVLRKLG